MTQTKILIITRNLPPLIGGMERLNWHIADELSKLYPVHIISHQQAKAFAPEKCGFSAAPLTPLLWFLITSFFLALWQCLRNRPSILLAGSGLTAPIVVILANVFKIKSIVYLHGLDIATNHQLYKLLWLPLIRRADQVISNSSRTEQICREKGILPERLSIIHPGVSYPPLEKNNALIAQLQQQYQLYGKKILISVGRLTQRKGLNEFVDISLPYIVKQQPNTVLIIIGDTPNHSLKKDLQSKQQIYKTARKHDLAHHIIFTGNISDDQVLASFYYLADIHIFPVKHIAQDPEGFGMVAIEAATHGTATIAFATGGIIDAVKHQHSGYLINPADYAQLSKQVIKLLKCPSEINAEDCKDFARQFAWHMLADKFLPIINR